MLPALVSRHWPLYASHSKAGMVLWYSDISGETPLLQTQEYERSDLVTSQHNDRQMQMD